MVGIRHILGLAIDDAGVVATELTLRAGQTEVHRTGELLWEQELTAESVKPLGQRLRHFLHEQGFSSKRAVVGLAAKWVLTTEVAASPEALAGVLGIQAERAFSMDADELIFDYCGKTSTSEKSQVLLLAARRQIVHQVKELIEAAGLQVQSITLSALACSKILSESSLTNWYGLYTRPTYCEFWAQIDGSPRFIKHVPIGKNGTPEGYADLLASTVERLVLLSPVPGQLPPYKVTAYDACGLPNELIDGLSERLGPQIMVANGRAGVRAKGLGLGDRPDRARAIAAAAVAMTGVGTERPLIDFLNPRVGAKKAVSHKRTVVWGAGIAGACVLALAILLLVWQVYAGEVAANAAWLQANSSRIATAQEFADNYRYVEPWIDRQPRFLECLRDLTEAFPEEPSVWAKNLILNENGTGSIGGSTMSQTNCNDVLDKMRQNKIFTDVKLNHFRLQGKDSREAEFLINFKFQGMK
jgi:hypothetical protein